ncbi:thioesterase [Mycetocola tolaasinivorans]|uniref:Thioesterase n=1 Tax=Mycetocola tolaasinivorans TaxID=76635 RepID=A0A3L6ZXQ4_9MICO|nr:thioesterase family protein [Mycetocola tolaasinivorans]RLP72697.1 thioesterase [Mycetocola tolaasinivorans]
MHLIFRTLLVVRAARRLAARGDTLGHYDVGRVRLRTLLTDLDILRHMNNGVYLSIFDLGRLNLMIRNGMWGTLEKNGWYAVVVNQTISYRRSLTLGQRFTVESRIVGVDEEAGYIEHRIVCGGEVYTRALVRARFIRKSGGTVKPAELLAAAGAQSPPEPLPAWVEEWRAAVALPRSRAEAPSTWPGEWPGPSPAASTPRA